MTNDRGRHRVIARCEAAMPRIRVVLSRKKDSNQRTHEAKSICRMSSRSIAIGQINLRRNSTGVYSNHADGKSQPSHSKLRGFIRASKIQLKARDFCRWRKSRRKFRANPNETANGRTHLRTTLTHWTSSFWIQNCCCRQ